jgi:ubiquinone/menaquinone biosynthesis C-methylase UbiE
MGLYADGILPHLIHLGMRQEPLTAYRRRVLAKTSGRVLEIGVGSGLNLPLYDRNLRHVVGIEPAAALLAMARDRWKSAPGRIALVQASAEHIPVPSESVESVVTTWTLCSIANVSVALDEMRRVLTPGGVLLFAEHGRSPDARVRQWQNRLTPIWKRIAGGCHLNRPIDDLLREAGFEITDLENSYIPGPRPLTYMYEGSAVRAR